MEAQEIFKNIIGIKLKGLVLKYSPYNDTFNVFPYHHEISDDFEHKFSDLMFDSIVFYAYEKDEIEKDYFIGRLENLRKCSRAAYEMRVPKTEKEYDGLLGELALDAFLKTFFPNIEMLYSRVKYLERYPKKETPERKGHEIKGYDGLVFSIENTKKYMWVGQVKTGDWQYCLKGIKEDINKSVIKHYFADAMVILADIMKAASSSSDELQKIIDKLNGFIFDYSQDETKLHSKIIKFFQDEKITIRIPCLIIADETNYEDKKVLYALIKEKISTAFENFSVKNDIGIDIEVLLLIFPVKNLGLIRKEFLEVRKN